VRSNILQENPDMSVTEVAKEAGVRWKNLSSDDKAPYEEQAREDKERYKREMAAYEGAAADNDE
jgi:high mobility group protein B1